MGTIFIFFFVVIALISIWMLLCGGIGILWALVENSVGGAILGGFIVWCIACVFFDCSWNDMTAAWWGVILGAIVGLYLTYDEVKYLF